MSDKKIRSIRMHQWHYPSTQAARVRMHLEIDEISLMTLELLGLEGRTVMYFDNYRYGTTNRPLIGFNPNKPGGPFDWTVEPEWLELDDVFDEDMKHQFLLNLQMEMSDNNLSY